MSTAKVVPLPGPPPLPEPAPPCAICETCVTDSSADPAWAGAALGWTHRECFALWEDEAEAALDALERLWARGLHAGVGEVDPDAPEPPRAAQRARVRPAPALARGAGDEAWAAATPLGRVA